MAVREKICFITPDLSPEPKQTKITNKSKISNRFKAVYRCALAGCFAKNFI